MTRIIAPLAPVRLIGVAIAALLLAWATAAVAAPTVVGIAAAVVNDVRISVNAGKSYPAAKVRQRVSLGHRVRTGSASRLQLVLFDKTKFSVGANAQLTIDRFVYDPNGGEVSASILQGVFRFFSGKSRNAKKTVRTPSATIGIRGTIFDGAVGATAVAIAQRENAVPRDIRHDPLTATLVVLRGPGPARQANLPVGLVDVTGGDQTVTLDAPLMAAYVPYAGAAPIGPFPISSSGLGQLSDFIVTPPGRTDAPFNMSSLPFPDSRPNGAPPPYYPGAYGRPVAGDWNGDASSGRVPGVGGFPGMPGFGDFPHRPGGRGNVLHNDDNPGPNDPPRGSVVNQVDPDPRQPSGTPPTTDNPGVTNPRQPGTPLGTLSNDPRQPRDPLGTQTGGPREPGQPLGTLSNDPGQPRDPYENPNQNAYPTSQQPDPYPPSSSLNGAPGSTQKGQAIGTPSSRQQEDPTRYRERWQRNNADAPVKSEAPEKPAPYDGPLLE